MKPAAGTLLATYRCARSMASPSTSITWIPERVQRANSRSAWNVGHLPTIRVSVVPATILDGKSRPRRTFSYACSRTKFRDILDGTSHTIMVERGTTKPIFCQRRAQGMDTGTGSPHKQTMSFLRRRVTGGTELLPKLRGNHNLAINAIVRAPLIVGR